MRNFSNLIFCLRIVIDFAVVYVRNFWKEKAIWQKLFSSDWGAYNFQDLCDFSFPKSHLFLDQILSSENAFPKAKKTETNQLNARKAFWSSPCLYDGSRSRFQIDLNLKLTVNELAGELFRLTGVLSRLTGVLFFEAPKKFGLSVI